MKINAIAAKTMVENVVKSLPIDEKGEDLFFAVDVENETIIPIRVVENEPRPSDFLNNFLFQVRFDEADVEKSVITLFT